MPRNDFLARTYPLPKTQGLCWHSSLYRCWTDAIAPREWEYRHFTARASDLNWTINQVRFAAAWGDSPGVLRIRMGTFTPHFDTYQVKLDGGGWVKAASVYRWKLRPGRNRLDMRIRNVAGVAGPVSHLVMEYQP